MIFKQGIRFFLSSLVNTISGLSLIYLLLFIGTNDYVANISGYLFGVIISFFLYKSYVFRTDKVNLNEVLMFIFVFLISYLINFLILYISLFYLNNYVSQLLSMVGYSATSFFLNKFFVFKK